MRTSIIPQLTAWSQGNRNLPAPLAPAGASAGVPLLPGQLGPRARMAIEIAWGADPNGNPDAWSWTDITTDVMYADGPAWFRLGRTDESSDAPAAELQLTLDNRQARYSLGGLSPNWPNVRENVPMRVRVDPDGVGFEVAWQGFAVGFTPSWDETGRIATVSAVAAGSMRRLIQNQVPRSSAERYLRSLGPSQAPRVYYPLNEGQLATVGNPAVGTGRAAIKSLFLGGATSPFFGRGHLAGWVDEGLVLKEFATVRCSVPQDQISTGQWWVSFLVSYVEGNPEPAGAVDNVVVAQPGVIGDADGWNATLGYLDKDITLYKPGSATPILGPQFEEFLFDGGLHLLSLVLTQVGADVWFQVLVDEATIATAVVPATTYKHPTEVFVSMAGDTARYAGHLAVFTDGQIPFSFDLVFAMMGRNHSSIFDLFHYNETALERMVAVAAQERIPLQIIGDTGDPVDTEFMGPQQINGAVDELLECAQADWGTLFDGLGPGLHYVTRDSRENTPAVLTLDVANRELFPDFLPKHDDFSRVNKAKARNTFGSDNTYEDVTGPLGTAAVGIRERPIEVNLDFDESLPDFAAWLVHLGTLEGYRYPQVTINLRAVPRLARAVLALRPGSRIDLVNVDTVLVGHSTGVISLMVEGSSTVLSPFDWIVTLQCSPFAGWRIIQLGQPSGDTSEFLGYLMSSGSRVAAPGAAPGATSLVVETTAGPVWTQAADDYPQYLSVGGIRVRATACTGAASPQTFTVDPLPTGIPGLIDVQVWDPAVPRL